MGRRDKVVMAMGLFVSQMGTLHAESSEQIEPSEPVKVESATITLNANVNASDWVEDESQLSWSLAFSDTDIIRAVTQLQGKTYNQPTLSVEGLKRHLILQGVANGSSVSVEVPAGQHDWVILVDIDGDDQPDSYIGSLAEDIQLDQHPFEANRSYFVDITADGRIQYRAE